MKKINWRYTFGEILIVIIGISIAFSINKYSENRSDNQLRQQYLLNLKKDVEEDKKELEENIHKLDEKTAIIREILPVLSPGAEEKDIISKNLATISSIIDFSPNNITYLSLINSGDMKLIDDFKLKTSIEGHYSGTYRSLSMDYERQVAINKKYLADYYIDHLDFDRVKKGGSAFGNKDRLKRILNSIYGACIIKKQSSLKAIESCDELIKPS